MHTDKYYIFFSILTKVSIYENIWIPNRVWDAELLRKIL